MSNSEKNIKRVVEHSDISSLKNHIPERLYKYRYWNNEEKYKFHKNILTERQLFFSNSAYFDDPDDCRFPVKFDFTFESIKDRMKKTYLSLPGLHVLKDNQLDSLIKQQYYERFGTESARAIREKEFYDYFNSTLVIYCLSISNSNLNMWNKYGDNFKGFCVGFDFHKSLASLVEASIGGTYVNYVDTTSESLIYPNIHSKKGLEDYAWFFFDLINKKYNSWSFEKEYRLYKVNFDYLNDPALPKFNNVYTVPKICFNEVIFGSKMDEKNIEEIIDVCNRNNLSVNFKLAEPVGNSVVLRTCLGIEKY